jgi:hypothetical protein
MNRILVFILGAALGLLIGGGLIFYSLGGVPAARAKPPGEPIQVPDPNGSPVGTASVVLNQQFFDTVLATIFRDMNPPAFPLNITGQNLSSDEAQPQKVAFFQNSCDSKITLLPDGSGVKTGVRLENGKINAPLAFTGSASVFGSCYNFSGWAQATLNLRYDAAQQNVFGQIEVETVNLDGVTPFAGGIIARFVQASLNQRVNPITILRGEQIKLSLPISATDGTLNLKIKDVRSDVKENALSLYITFDFAGTKGGQM